MARPSKLLQMERVLPPRKFPLIIFSFRAHLLNLDTNHNSYLTKLFLEKEANFPRLAPEGRSLLLADLHSQEPSTKPCSSF